MIHNHPQPKELDNYWEPVPPNRMPQPINPNKIYNTQELIKTSDYIRLCGRDYRTIISAIYSGGLRALPRDSKTQPYQILGKDAIDWLERTGGR